MKRLKSNPAFPLAALLFAFLIFGANPAYAQTADDHGDTAATATTIRVGQMLSGELETSGDKDVFRIDFGNMANVETHRSLASGTPASILNKAYFYFTKVILLLSQPTRQEALTQKASCQAKFPIQKGAKANPAKIPAPMMTQQTSE